MAVTIQQLEGTPASYPPAPEYPRRPRPDSEQVLDAGFIWQRIEAYTSYRFTSRQVVWTVEGEGEWVPPLTPATVSQIDCWENGAWTANTPPTSPLGGYCFLGDGPYRVTADVGGGDVPPMFNEAFIRLARYMEEERNNRRVPGASKYSKDIDRVLSWEANQNPAWMARAIQNSGAGDLLRNYRRVS